MHDHGVQHLPETKILLSFITSRPVLQPTQISIHCTQAIMMTELTSHICNLHGMLKYKDNFIFTLHIWGPYQKSWANSFHNKVKVWIWKHQMLVKSMHCIHFSAKTPSKSMHFCHCSRSLKIPCSRSPFQQSVHSDEQLPELPLRSQKYQPYKPKWIIVQMELGPGCRMYEELSSHFSKSSPWTDKQRGAGYCQVAGWPFASLNINVSMTKLLESLKLTSSIAASACGKN
jgi:hypothetical protein